MGSESIVSSVVEAKGVKKYYPHTQRVTDLPYGWMRATFIVQKENFYKFKNLTRVKGLNMKETLNDLLQIFNDNALNTKDKEKLKDQRVNMIQQIKKMVDIEK